MIDSKVFYTTVRLYADVIDSIISANAAGVCDIAAQCLSLSKALARCMRLWDSGETAEAATFLSSTMHAIDAVAWDVSERVTYALLETPGSVTSCAELCNEHALFSTYVINKQTGELKNVWFDISAESWEVSCLPSA